MTENILSISNLSWQPNNEEKYILNDISSDFKEGGFYGILGPNGSGKTSLIKHILRFLEVKEGNISFVPQNVNMDVNFSVYDIIAMGRTPYLKRFQDLTIEDKAIIQHAMEITNCAYLKDKIFANLSGGESQRVLVARAIVQDTKYLILDEPISHLDIRYQIELMETLKRLNNEENKTIIAILHDLNLSSAYCKEIVLMKNGKIFSKGKVESVLTKENLKAVYEMDFEIQHLTKSNQLFFVPLVS